MEIDDVRTFVHGLDEISQSLRLMIALLPAPTSRVRLEKARIDDALKALGQSCCNYSGALWQLRQRGPEDHAPGG